MTGSARSRRTKLPSLPRLLGRNLGTSPPALPAAASPTKVCHLVLKLVALEAAELVEDELEALCVELAVFVEIAACVLVERNQDERATL